MRSPLDSLSERYSSPARLRLGGRDRILLLKRTALYLRAGIPIVETLSTLQRSSGSSRQKRMLAVLIPDIQSGAPLSRCLARFPRVYTSTHLQLIAIGEASGTLPGALLSLAGMLEDRARRIRSIIGVLTYPAVLFLGAVGISVFLLLYIFPKIIPIFHGLHSELPLSTRLLIKVSAFIQDHWVALFIVSAVVAFLTRAAFRVRWIRSHFDSFVLRLPLVGRLLRFSFATTASRIIATLLATGMRLDEALRLAHDSISNISCRAELGRLREAVLAGNSLSSALTAGCSFFPPLILQLASVGEMTGTLSDSLRSASQILEEELAEQMRTLSSLLEPLIMLIMGLFIGFIAMAMISPMYGITQSLGS